MNVDYTDNYATGFKQGEIGYCGTFAKVDIVAVQNVDDKVGNGFTVVLKKH